ncbi:NAD(P)H-hydrate dehydratase [Maritalea mediterranea]|uniref:Bifunctional NAD(P)H-hydrate repair enzyme n=1 Tax=Maritalea mediterranea TaxID=2909667 RepID=A0ABS9E730_9HYPH|nr:NAD(P)H-hydrate dehydratase [Maritalea mediterranea]MCF4098593.1 NAD(P)H-hydrate dehydratase [Maritalea mediterranea]
MKKESEHLLLTPDQMGTADRLTIQKGVPEFELMQNAGQVVADYILTYFAPCAVGVLCGPGNNGGDGFVVARLLRDAGWSVKLTFQGAREKLGDAARKHLDLWGTDDSPVNDVLADSELLVEALFGAGLDRDVTGTFAELIKRMNRTHKPIVAIDMPSGIDGATGEVRGRAVRALASVSFFRLKPGHFLLPGKSYCGNVHLGQIGILESVLPRIDAQLWYNGPDLWTMPPYEAGGHKYSRGHCLVLSGDELSGGAARLCAMAALRSGAGLVSLFGERGALVAQAPHVTEIMLKPEPLDELLKDERNNCLVLGPGAGANAKLRDRVLAAIAAKRACVLDADALTAFAGDPKALFDHIKRYGGDKIVLTPHDGEFARLFAGLDLAAGKVEKVRQAAHMSGAQVLLKGADTVIGAPDGRVVINANAPAILATAGSGDVLAGIIGGMLARGMSGFDAACAGAFIHGAAAQQFGKEGLIASDIMAELPDMLMAMSE